MPKPKTTLVNLPSNTEKLNLMHRFGVARANGPLATVDLVTYPATIIGAERLAMALVNKANVTQQMIHVAIGRRRRQRPGCDVLVAPGDQASQVQLDIMKAYLC